MKRERGRGSSQEFDSYLLRYLLLLLQVTKRGNNEKYKTTSPTLTLHYFHITIMSCMPLLSSSLLPLFVFFYLLPLPFQLTIRTRSTRTKSTRTRTTRTRTRTRITTRIRTGRRRRITRETKITRTTSFLR